MEKKKYYTVRVSKKLKDVYKNVSYTKSELLASFRRKYFQDYSYYVSVYEEFSKIPPNILGGKFNIIAPVNVKSKEEIKAFVGYMIEILRKVKGDVKSAINFIRRDLLEF